MKQGNKTALIGLAVAGLLVTGGAAADEEDRAWSLDLRYRLESVQQDGLPDDALASTLRTRLGLASHEWKGWQGFIEFEDVHVVGIDDYNSTKNGNVTYPVVADPEDTELNQAYLAYGLDDGQVKIGRQRINLGNLRFFGAVGFRQNEQTFDGARFAGTFGDLSMDVAVLTRANRIFGAHHPNPALANTDMQTFYIDLENSFGDVSVGGFVHGIDLDDSPGASHQNIGLRASGKHDVFDWRAEFAQQSDYADGSAMIDADYYRVDLGYSLEGWRLGIAQELLGGDGNYAFQTPFATLHKFNGVTDKFLSTPATGLVDTEVNVKGKLGDWTLGAAWHQFDSDVGSLNYGSEFSVFASTRLGDYTDFSVKLGDYSAEDYATDTTKVWVTLGMHF